jgi:hypothetical protein
VELKPAKGAEMLEPGYQRIHHIHRVTLVREKTFILLTVDENGNHMEENLGTIRSDKDWVSMFSGDNEELVHEAFDMLADHILERNTDFVQECEDHANQDMQTCCFCLIPMRKMTEEPFFWEDPDEPICASCHASLETLKQNAGDGITK